MTDRRNTTPDAGILSDAVGRIEELEDERAMAEAGIATAYAGLTAAGHDAKAVRAIVLLRRHDFDLTGPAEILRVYNALTGGDA